MKQWHIWRSEETAFILLDCPLKHGKHSFFLPPAVFIDWISPFAQTSVPRAFLWVKQESSEKPCRFSYPQESPVPALGMTKPLPWDAMALSLKYLLAIFCHPPPPPPYTSPSTLFQPLSSIYPLVEARETWKGDTVPCPAQVNITSLPSEHTRVCITGPFHCAPRPGPRTNFFVKWRSKRERGEGKSSTCWSQWAGSNL